MIETVLAIVTDRQHSKLLLGQKKSGVGVGKLNGPGGKIEAGENAIQALIRETKEEFGLDIVQKDVEEVAECSFHFPSRPEWEIHNRVFLMHQCTGEPRETEEMGKPLWFDTEQLPFEMMWTDDMYWLPRVLRGERLQCEFWFADNNGTAVERYHITPL